MRRKVMMVVVSIFSGACVIQGGGVTQAGRAEAPPVGVQTRGVAAVAETLGLDLFDSCDQVLTYLQDQALARVTPWGLDGFGGWPVMPAMEGATATTAASEAPDTSYSTTNVQEAGVDEPDVVKTDGDRIIALAQGKLFVVDVTGAEPVLAGSVQIDQGFGSQMLLFGDTALVIGSGDGGIQPLMFEGDATGIWWQPPDTILTEVDLTDPSHPIIVSRLTVEGQFVAGRLTDGVARIVLTSQPQNLSFVTPDIIFQRMSRPGAPQADWTQLERQSEAINRRVILGSTIEQWFPRYRFEQLGGAFAEKEGVFADCQRMAHPEEFSGLAVTSILTLDLERGMGVTDTFGLVSDAGTVYASTDSIYVATQQWHDWQAVPENQWDQQVEMVTTTIHRFDTADRRGVAYTGSGEVPGWLYSQWAMSEHEGRLRVASTTQSPWWGWRQDSESMVSVLESQDGRMVTVGRVSGLGRGEQIYGVRFIGETGYVVTFRQTDPLYTIDLSEPSLPTLAGELKLPGYSAYLHPIGEGLLLGVGQDADLDGRVKGTQVAVFDVSDPSAPRQLDKLTLPGGYSEAELDHHAFLFWAATGTAVLPIQQARSDVWWSGALAFQVGREGVWLQGEIAQPGGYIQRTLVVGDALFSVSDLGIQANDLETLDQLAWLGF